MMVWVVLFISVFAMLLVIHTLLTLYFSDLVLSLVFVIKASSFSCLLFSLLGLNELKVYMFERKK